MSTSEQEYKLLQEQYDFLDQIAEESRNNFYEQEIGMERLEEAFNKREENSSS